VHPQDQNFPDSEDQHHGIPAALESPPAGVPDPPSRTRKQELPFSTLLWEDFEKLCLRLVRKQADVEFCRRYGVSGQGQAGIDLFSRNPPSTKYHVHQCKRVADLLPNDIERIVEKFLAGKWVAQAEAFTLCTTASLRRTELSDELERQRVALASGNIAFHVWDADELNIILKDEPELVDDFFGREWATTFCSEASLPSLDANRIDGRKMAELRSALATFYGHVFQVHDPGIPLGAIASSNALPLEDRYVLPDIIDENVQQRPDPAGRERKSSRPNDSASTREAVEGEHLSNHLYRQRRQLDEWLAGNKRAIVLGGPGLGKSTLLRFIALDLLSKGPRLANVSRSHGCYLPVWISFPYWTSALGRTGASEISLSGIVRSWLASWNETRIWPLFESALKDKRLLLLVDGLDEYSSEASAQVAVQLLQVFVAQRDCPVIAAGRYAGFERLGLQRSGWRAGELAEFTLEQQTQLAFAWLAHLHGPPDGAAASGADTRARGEAEGFVAELQRSPDLRELAKTPLLLTLLIYFRFSNLPLPQGRFRAYGQLIEHLIAVHPRRRQAAGFVTSSRGPLQPSETREVLAALAAYVQVEYPEGIFPIEQALGAIREHLTAEEGFALSRAEARRIAQDLFEAVEMDLGILVRRGPTDVGFLHRAFQEYLAAESIARFPFTRQQELVLEHCVDTRWREVVLALLQLTKRPDDIDSFVKIMLERGADDAERYVIDLILCELAVGDFNCRPGMALDLCRKAVDEIEGGTWLPKREQILRRVLEGLNSAKVRDFIGQHLSTWYPARAYASDGALSALAEISHAPEVVDALFRALLNPGEYNAAESSEAIAKLAPKFPELAEKLVSIISKPYPAIVRANATAALLAGWPGHPMASEITAKCDLSASPDLRLYAIKWRALRGLHSQQDLRDLLRAASSGNWRLRPVIISTILKGWPADPEVKRACLNTYSRRAWGQQAVDYDIAVQVLLSGYSADTEVVDTLADRIRAEDHPIPSFGLADGWETLSENFRGNPVLIPAIDQWFARQGPHSGVELSFAVRLGATELGRQKLLDSLAGGFIHWPAEALLDLWGINDPKVGPVLTQLAESDRAPHIGHLLPRIITDQQQCYEKITSLLTDPQCARPDFLVHGLFQLPLKGREDEAVDLALRHIRDGDDRENVSPVLIQHLPNHPVVRELAVAELNKRNGLLAVIARSYGNDASFRNAILSRVAPLPERLRSFVVDFCSENASALPMATDLLRRYDEERAPEIKTQAAIAYYRAVAASGKPRSAYIERLVFDMKRGGPDHEERGQAAFCGLDLVGGIDAMFASEVRYGTRTTSQISLGKAFSTNIPLVRHILSRWTELKGTLGQRFWETFSGMGEAPVNVWEHLAPLADSYSAPREEAIEFVRTFPGPLPVELLDFTARVLPKSRVLLEHCTKIILGRDMQPQRRSTALRAAEIIGRDFYGDAEALAPILGNVGPWLGHGLLAVTYAMPNAPELKAAAEAFRHALGTAPRGIQDPSEFAAFCCLGDDDDVVEVVVDLLARPQPSLEYFYSEMAQLLVGRCVRSERLQEALWRRVTKTTSPSELCTFANALGRARGLSPDLQCWAKENVRPGSASCDLNALGTDLIAGEVRPVWEVCMELLLLAGRA
jgi:hypothetical protein